MLFFICVPTRPLGRDPLARLYANRAAVGARRRVAAARHKDFLPVSPNNKKRNPTRARMADGPAPTSVSVANGDLTCKVCYQIYVSPRIFPGCGHSMCGPCSVEIDKQTRAANAHTCRCYKCPFCRQTTTVPWFRRPVNHALEALAQQHPQYEERLKEVGDHDVSLESIPKDLDLADISNNARVQLAVQCYTTLMPLLLDAAKSGSAKLVVAERNLVRDIEKTSDLVASLLFDHNVYKLQVNPSLVECTVSITPLAYAVNHTHTNNRTTAAGGGGDPPPPGLRPPGRLRSRAGSPLPPPPPPVAPPYDPFTAAAANADFRGLFRRLRPSDPSA